MRCVTLAFFSASGSKLAALHPADRCRRWPRWPAPPPAGPRRLAPPRRARRGGAILACVALGVGILYSARHNGFVPHAAHRLELRRRSRAAARRARRDAARRAAPAASGAAGDRARERRCLRGSSCCAPSRGHPAGALGARPGRRRAALVRPATPLYSVGQYRETLSPYLARTLQLVDYEGELQFGLERGAGSERHERAAVRGRAGAPAARPWHSSTRSSGTQLAAAGTSPGA